MQRTGSPHVWLDLAEVLAAMKKTGLEIAGMVDAKSQGR
jgi:hypothetical protein